MTSHILTFVDSYGQQSWARAYGSDGEKALENHLNDFASQQYVGMECITRPEYKNTGLKRFRIGERPTPIHRLTAVSI